MKNLNLQVIFSLLCILGCDQIEPPYTQNLNLENPNKVILVEKFTGHKCSNCPKATLKIKELKEDFQNAIIPVSIHPGGLPEFTNTDNNYPYDFTTNASDVIANDMGANFLPLGTINRVEGDFNRCFLKDEWYDEIYNQLYNSSGNPLPKTFDIQITTSLNNKELSIETNINKLISLNNNYRLCLIIIEDSIIAPQIDDKEYIANYRHDNIYRCAINDIYGENLDFNNNIWIGTHTMSFNNNYNINWHSEWDNLHNCYVVGYVYNAESLVIEESFKTHVVYE